MERKYYNALLPSLYSSGLVLLDLQTFLISVSNLDQEVKEITLNNRHYVPVYRRKSNTWTKVGCRLLKTRKMTSRWRHSAHCIHYKIGCMTTGCIKRCIVIKKKEVHWFIRNFFSDTKSTISSDYSGCTYSSNIQTKFPATPAHKKTLQQHFK